MFHLCDAQFSRERESTALHFHRNLHQMLYVCRGGLSLQIDDADYVVEEPSVIFISRLERHAVTLHDDVYERYTFNFDPEDISHYDSSPLWSVFTDRPANFCHVLPLGDAAERIDTLLRMAWEEFQRADAAFPHGADDLIQSALLLLYRHAPGCFPLSAERGSATVVPAIRRRIETNLQQDVTLAALGQQFHLNPYYIAHLFKDVTGYSVKNYQLRCRIAAARTLLETTRLAMTEVSDRVGFPDTSSFSRYFHREVGVPPTKYRKMFQEKTD